MIDTMDPTIQKPEWLVLRGSDEVFMKTGGERGIRTPQNPANNNGNPHDDAQIDSQIPVASSPELSQVVTAWEKLPAPLKTAILAIVKTAE